MNGVTTKVILDASAILAVVHEETGAEVVIEALNDAWISAVNYAEVITKLVERNVAPALAIEAVQKLGVRVVDFDINLARRVGLLRAITKQSGLSLADRACIALAEREQAPVLTGDRNWSNLSLGIDVRLIR
jgi:ribonuclease VapC